MPVLLVVWGRLFLPESSHWLVSKGNIKKAEKQLRKLLGRKDVELQSCSMAAQGLWINAMCLAHECEPYGHLTVNGKGMTVPQLARQVGLAIASARLVRMAVHDPDTGAFVPGFFAEGRAPLDLCLGVLGAGNSSLLWDELREKRKLVHAIDAHAIDRKSVV